MAVELDEHEADRRVDTRGRRRWAAAEAAATAGGWASLSAVLLGLPQLTAQAHAVRVGSGSGSH